MISFKQYITEIFDSSYKTERKVWDKNQGKFTFTDDNNHKFTGRLFRDGIGDHKTLEITFHADGKDGPRSSVTDAGSKSLKVFGTIGNEVRQYVKDYPVKEIEFRSIDKRTVPLYSLLAKRIARETNGTVETDRWSSRPIFRIFF